MLWSLKPVSVSMGGIRIDFTRFIGWRARLWDYSPSHSRLVVRLVSDEKEAFLVLSCCDEISAPVFWIVTKPVVNELADPFVELVDDGVRVRCQEVSLEASYVRSP